MKNNFAVVKISGKQYLVKEGDILTVDKLDGQKEDISFSDVLLIASSDNKIKIGRPLLTKTKIQAKILMEGKGKKVSVIKYKPKIRYKKKRGHRQPYTKIKIERIVA